MSSRCADESEALFSCAYAPSTLQEIDIATNTLLFEWRSLEHVDPSETYFEIAGGAGNSSSNPFDHCHIK